MHIVVTNDGRLPLPIQSTFDVNVMTFDDFIEKAEQELTVDEGLWINVTYMDEATYKSLMAVFQMDEFVSQVGLLHFFKFEGQPNLPYTIAEYVDVYPNDVPVQEPQPEPVQPVVQPPVQQPVPQPVQPVQQPVEQVYEPEVQENINEPVQKELPVEEIEATINDMPDVTDMVSIAGGNLIAPQRDITNKGTRDDITNIIIHDELDTEKKRRKSDGRVYLVGSSKGGVGKTTTGLMLVHHYAKTHPKEKIAFADFDVIDGQVSAAIHKQSPTLYNFYQVYNAGKKSFSDLYNCRVKSEHFNYNVDFYLAPPQDIPSITNNEVFWSDVFELLIKNYDVIFFDSAIDYLEKKPVSMLYKIADVNFIITNTAMFSIKSVIRQLRTLAGARDNNVYSQSMDILSRCKVILTRVSSDPTDAELNKYIINLINDYAPVVGAFGNIDPIIGKIQWYQSWELLDEDVNPEIYDMLDKILEEAENDDDENDQE